MRKLFSIAVAIAGLAYGAAYAADDSDPELPNDSRIKMLMYDESDVYTITTRYGYQTNIVFSPKEEIETISVGDRSVWQIIPAGNRLFIRPMDEDVTTNMTILTNKHSYQFDLKSIAADKAHGNIYVAKFVYPEEKKPAPVVASAPAVAAPIPAAPAPAPTPTAPASAQPYVMVPSPFNYAPSVPSASNAEASHVAAPMAMVPASVSHTPNYNYTYSGSDELAPLQVYDDGSATMIKYASLNQPLPDVFIVDPAGKENAVPYSTRGDTIVVDAVTGEIVVRNKNGGAVHIFNEALNPG